ncbi:MAG: hypothetical protein P3W97_005865 [Tepidimonas sp.]|uniref:hypothetical protein n=1 Tax=Tepidimonas sp. TaxID=2002775 RepID=UPI00259EDAC0|nr:hypothetical protein [Tepidimonas sp.]MDM7456774.1 hypothetical protein [Tepidimonas sp.]
MDIGTVMNTMRDPAGVPAHPVLFQGLMVITWVLHIAFVHLTLGAAGLAIYSFYQRGKGPFWGRLSMAMTKVAKVGVSLLIVLGVAPLLFTQVIYDPQWYVSNVLSGRWVIAFIFTLIVGYCSWFIFYYANHEGAKRYMGIFAWVALALFCLDGLIMHALSYQELLPAQWMNWYAPNGVVDTSGSSLHAIQWPRYVFIMSLSLPAVGVFLIAYAHYFATRADREPEYRQYVRSLGQRLAVWGFAFSLIPFLFWQFAHPDGSGLAAHPIGWGLALSLIGMLVWTKRLKAHTNGYLPVVGGFGVLALLALWREIVRIAHLKPLGYDIATYTVHVDWPSTLLFFSTFVGVGGLVGGFYLTLLYRAGRVQGLYTADRSVARLGTGAVAVLGLWIAVFFVYGIVIWLRNSFV